jgi:hypothetical protein
MKIDWENNRRIIITAVIGLLLLLLFPRGVLSAMAVLFVPASLLGIHLMVAKQQTGPLEKPVVYGFVLAPIIFCLGLETFWARNNSQYIFHYFFFVDISLEVIACYLTIALIAKPMFFALSRRTTPGFFHCVISGFISGCIAPAAFFLFFGIINALLGNTSASDSGGETMRDGVETLHGLYADSIIALQGGGIGAGIGFIFWILALSPISLMLFSKKNI